MAYAAYVTVALFLIYVLLRLYLQRLRNRNRLQLQEALTQAKLDYFTNISHDLLTPLSVISCVGDYWERKYPTEKRQTTVLRHNIYRLKRLLQQVLDFRKTENGNMVLRPEEGDIFAFARQLCTHILPLAEQKGVRLNLRIPEANAGAHWILTKQTRYSTTCFPMPSNTRQVEKMSISSWKYGKTEQKKT